MNAISTNLADETLTPHHPESSPFSQAGIYYSPHSSTFWRRERVRPCGYRMHGMLNSKSQTLHITLSPLCSWPPVETEVASPFKVCCRHPLWHHTVFSETTIAASLSMISLRHNSKRNVVVQAHLLNSSPRPTRRSTELMTMTWCLRLWTGRPAPQLCMIHSALFCPASNTGMLCA